MGERLGRKSLWWWRRRKHISVILKATKKYAGNIVLRELESVTPEVGIDIVEKYQRQGIAYDTLQLFMRKVKSICKIDYFLSAFIRIMNLVKNCFVSWEQ